MDENRERLELAITKEFDRMNEYTPYSEEYEVICENLDRLYRLRIDEDTVVNENSKNKWERWLKLGLDGMGIVLPIWFYGRWMKRGFKFEETGVITSSTFRGLTKLFSPRRVKS